jgi:hypothetical protein
MRTWIALIPAVAAVWCTGCASFERRWRDAGLAGEPAGSIAGRWIGTWRNTNNSHADTLRAILRPNGENRWDAEFHARYGGVFTFSILTVLDGATESDGIRFHGEKNLGFLAGGVYKFAGFATINSFSCTYSSDQNSGVFLMHRP